MSAVYDIQIVEQAFEPFQAIQQFQTTYLHNRTDYGANTLFIGTMRDFNEGDTVNAMTLSHYPAMTTKQLEQLMQDCLAQEAIQAALIVHRVGFIQPAEPIVLISVWSAHRQAAFAGCRQLIEALKHQAPFWKKEHLSNGDQRWVERNTG